MNEHPKYIHDVVESGNQHPMIKHVIDARTNVASIFMESLVLQIRIEMLKSPFLEIKEHLFFGDII